MKKQFRHAVLFLSLSAAGFAHATSTPTTWTVNTCSEGTSGSGTSGTLRYAVLHAASGDIVDLSTLSTTCSVISLSTGAIDIEQSSLTITGPGRSKLTIASSNGVGATHDRVFYHKGTGTLSLKHLSVADGDVNLSGAAEGGCILTKGGLYLQDVSANACKAISSAGYASGGAIAVAGNLTVKYSVISNSQSQGGGPAYAVGGGLVVKGSSYIKYSTIENNTVSSSSQRGFGGGAALFGKTAIFASTISGNSATYRNGGLEIYPPAASSKVTITNSTISGNRAYAVGGMVTNALTVTLKNSTITSNYANAAYITYKSFVNYAYTYYTQAVSPGLALVTQSSPTAIEIESSIISGNYYSGGPAPDLGNIVDGRSSVTITGANNMMGVRPNGPTVPADTIVGYCPHLGPLRNNGGPTSTHSLLSGSRAIDAGNNQSGASYDQRGGATATQPLASSRVSGAAADIGAYEVQQADVVFNTDFEGCAYLSQ